MFNLSASLGGDYKDNTTYVMKRIDGLASDCLFRAVHPTTHDIMINSTTSLNPNDTKSIFNMRAIYASRKKKSI